MSLLYAATYPERTSALVLYGSYAKRSWAPDYPFGWKDEQWERMLANIDQNWGTPQGTNIAMYAPSLMDKPDGRNGGVLFPGFGKPGCGRRDHEDEPRDRRPECSAAVHAPTMIIHRTGDRVSEVGHARYMAQQIAGAKLVELPGIDHAYWIDGGKVILDHIEQFLTGGLHAHEPERMLATVLFADIVGSTERVAKLGDGPWRQLLETFHGKSARYCNSIADVRSTPPAMVFSRPSTAPPEPFAVPAQSGTPCTRSGLRSVAAFTPGVRDRR